jgi:hypothetical protein
MFAAITLCIVCFIVSVEELSRIGSGNISTLWITSQILWGCLTAILEMTAFTLTLRIRSSLVVTSPARDTLFWLCYANLFMSVACML